MRKKIIDDIVTKAQKRAQKNRPRMKMHGKSLITSKRHAGKKLIKI